MTTELSQLLEEEEKRWMESLQVEEYHISLAKTVIQVGAADGGLLHARFLSSPAGVLLPACSVSPSCSGVLLLLRWCRWTWSGRPPSAAASAPGWLSAV